MKKIKMNIQSFIKAVKILFSASPKFFISKIVVTIMLAIVPFLPLYFWRILLNLIVDYITNKNGEIISSIIIFTVLYCLIHLVQFTVRKLHLLVTSKYDDDVQYYIDNILIEKIANIDLAFFDSSKLKDQNDYIASRLNACTTSVFNYFLSIIQSLLWILFAIVMISQLNIFLIIIIIATAVLTFFAQRYINKEDHKFNIEKSKQERIVRYFGGLCFGGAISDMKLFNLKDYFSRLYKNKWNKLYKDKVAKRKKHFLIESFGVLLATISEVSAYIFSIAKLISGTIGVGDVTFFVSIATEFQSYLSGFLSDISGYKEEVIVFNEVQEFIDMKPLLEKSGVKIPSQNPTIEFKAVGFKYPNSDKYVLQNCNFVVKSGETFGLVGLNGSGKSTIVKLLCRFYDPTEGQILIDGVDAREYDIVKLRALFGVLFQDYVSYSFTLRENIALSNISKLNDDDEIIKASQKSKVTDFTHDWEKGFDENLTRQFDGNGKELSGGQWQRIALARAFFRDAPVVLLDEPSAALDPIAEHEIFEDFADISKGKSTLLISHRLSSITLADKILVLENGKIIEQGAHKDLLSQNGRYAYLFNLQAGKYI